MICDAREILTIVTALSFGGASLSSCSASSISPIHKIDQVCKEDPLEEIRAFIAARDLNHALDEARKLYQTETDSWLKGSAHVLAAEALYQMGDVFGAREELIACEDIYSPMLIAQNTHPALANALGPIETRIDLQKTSELRKGIANPVILEELSELDKIGDSERAFAITKNSLGWCRDNEIILKDKGLIEKLKAIHNYLHGTYRFSYNSSPDALILDSVSKHLLDCEAVTAWGSLMGKELGLSLSPTGLLLNEKLSETGERTLHAVLAFQLEGKTLYFDLLRTKFEEAIYDPVASKGFLAHFPITDSFIIADQSVRAARAQQLVDLIGDGNKEAAHNIYLSRCEEAAKKCPDSWIPLVELGKVKEAAQVAERLGGEALRDFILKEN